MLPRRRAGALAALTGAAALVAAACGSGSGASSAANGSTGAAAKSQSSQPATITFLNTGASPKVLAFFNSTVIPGFEKANPGIKVEMSTVAWGSSFTKIETGVTSGNSDDVFLMGNIFLPVLASKHGLLPLTDFVKNWPVAKQLNQPAYAAGTYANVQYGVPVNLDVRGLIYNQEMLQKAGISSPPTNWAEYEADAAKVAHSGGKVEGVDWAIDNSVGLTQTFNLLIAEAGGQLFNNNPDGSATFTGDSAAGVKALTYLQSFYKQGLSSTSYVDIGSAPTPVALGEAAMEINNAASFSLASPTTEKQLRMTAPLSAEPGGTPVGEEFVNKLGIYAKTKYPEQSWKFVSYLFTPSVLSQWDALLGEAPPLPSLADTAPWNNGFYHAMVENEKYAQVFPVELQSTAIDEDLTRLIQKVIYQQLTPQAALAQMRSMITPLLK